MKVLYLDSSKKKQLIKNISQQSKINQLKQLSNN